MFKYSLLTTIAIAVWTAILPFINSEAWFINKWIHNLWVGFDIILILSLSILTIGIYKRKKYTRFLSPAIFGMIVSDWIFNIQLWIYGGYNLAEPRFIISFFLIAGVLIYFFWFTSRIQKESY